MKRAPIHAVNLILALLICAGISSAQVATGTPQFNSFGGGPFDVVNLGNLNVNFTIPVLHKAGRGMPFAYDLGFDNSIWTPVTTNGTTTWTPATGFGWHGLTANQAGNITYTSQQFSAPCNPPNNMNPVYFTVYANWIYHDGNGATHLFGVATGTGTTQFGCASYGPATSGTGTTNDGSGYTLSVNLTNATLYTTAGKILNVPINLPGGASSVTDANGNQITTNSTGVITDTLGQAVLTTAGGAPNPITFQYTAPSGATPQVKVTFATYTVKTVFGCTGVGEYNQSGVSLVDKVTLADGSFYQFWYEATPGGTGQVTGRIAKVALPTGGALQYTYDPSTDGHNGIICSDGSTDGLKRTVNGGLWTYTRTQVSGKHWQTKITTPPDPTVGDDTVIDFQEDGAASYPTYSFYETQRQNYQGTAPTTLLLTTVTCWNGNTSNCPTTSVSSPVSSVAATLQYPSSGLQSKTVTTYNTNYGLVTEVDQYAYASGAPTVLARKMVIGYATLGNNIMDHPSLVTVYDGSNNLLSKSAYTYDESAYPIQTSNGTTQHTSVTGSRGNATTITSYTNGTATLSRHFQYYDTGTVYKAYDVNGAITTYSYPDATSTCDNAFPTGYTLPISGLSSSASTTWNCVGAVATAVTDLNGNTTTTTYNDPYFWRPASVADPTSATTAFTYTPYSTSALAKMDSQMVFNSSKSVVEHLATVGLYGQTLYSQQHEAPSGQTNSANYDSTQVLYDSLLRAYRSSMPCVSTTIAFTDQNQACPSAAVTTSTFDALGRVTQTTDGGNPIPGYVQYTYNQNDVKQDIGPAPSGENDKQKQLEYDALGRLTSVCELTSLTGYAQCGQTNPHNGYMTTYAYSVNASGYPTMTVTQGPSGSTQTRVYTYDLLGRLISEQNPENGAVTYTYDSDSAGTCSGTYNGDLVKLTDAKGNKICYQYDALHRVTSITYPTGPDSANTPTKTMVYDSATFNSTPMSNPKGRLVEAYTGAAGSKTTDEFFSYSVRGELTDTYECTPHSGTNGCASVSNYYHVWASFWANGALNTLNSNISGLPNQTYVVDGMGRTNGVTASAGQTPLVISTGTSYDLANSRTTVKYGSGDSDVVQLDQYTGRMKSYTFNVGSQSVTGTLSWNPNGSLGTLAITNQLNSLDTQTCSYTHDDLARIYSVGCVNGSTNRWNQNFTYDAFGNITKTVPVGGAGTNFLSTYSGSSNWLTALPGCTPTTDSNGQMTYDCAHNYTWDVEHKMHSVDANPASCSTSGECLTYDALGRMVEKTVGSTYTQIVFGPNGRFATMNGQTFASAFIPLPGAQAVYTKASLLTSNKVAYYRHTDHLGSSRLATTPTQTLYSSTAYGPYGEPYSQAGTTDLSFTGQEQDTVSGIDDFLERKYPTVQGRWLSPDPGGLAVADPANPQSWNRYAYVLNNPMALNDPLGLDPPCGNNTNPCGPQGPTSLAPMGCICYNRVDNTPFWSGQAPGDMIAQGERVYTSCMAVNFNCDANGNYVPPDGQPVITVSCSGTFSQIDCAPPPQAVAGSQDISIFTSNGMHHALNLLAQYQANPMSAFGKDVLQQLDGMSGAAQQFIIVGYAGSAVGAVGGALLEDAAAVEEGAIFGTRAGGNTPLLNSNDTLRVGWSYIRATDEYVFRIGGDLVPDWFNGGHINLWPPRWWFGRPAP